MKKQKTTKTLAAVSSLTSGTKLEKPQTELILGGANPWIDTP